MTDTTSRPAPSALPPSEAELAEWRALSRDEQVARYRETLEAPDAGRISKATMANVLAAARKHGAHGHSAEAEARLLTQPAPDRPGREPGRSLYDRVHDRFVPVGGVDLELPPHVNQAVNRPASSDGHAGHLCHVRDDPHRE